MQVEYLAQMETDAVNLEMCTKEIRSQIIRNAFSRSTQQRMSKGQDYAMRCTQWYVFRPIYWFAYACRQDLGLQGSSVDIVLGWCSQA